MSLPPLSPYELLQLLVYAGVFSVLCVFLPVQVASKIRRVRRSKHRITCRICGFRFLRKDKEATCSHCGSRNR